MTKYKRFIKPIYICAGLFGFIAYFSYLIKLFIWDEGTLPFCVAVAGCIIAGVPVFFRKFFEEKLPKKLFNFLESLFAWGMLFYAVTFIALSVYIFSASSFETPIDKIDDNAVIITYGAGLRGEKPGTVLRKRLDKTAELMNEKENSVCIVSGGRGSNEVRSEASAMKEYLVSLGIDEKRIYIEEKSHNTIENIQFSKEIIKEEKLEGREVVSISNSFHIPRIQLISQRLSFETDFLLAKDPTPYSLYTILVREYMSYANLFLFGAEQ